MTTALLDLVFPAFCVGCESPGTALCPLCSEGLREPMEHTPRPRPPGLPTIAVAGAYDGAVRAALLAYKEEGRRELVRPLGTALAQTIWFVLHLCGASSQERPITHLVPVPSRRSAARARGGDHVLRLTRGAAAVLRRAGLPVSVRPVLRVAESTLDSAGLGAAERAHNIAGSMSVRRRPVPPTAVILDDLVTTGATLREACRALRAAGCEPLAAAAVAGTQRRREPLPAGRAFAL